MSKNNTKPLLFFISYLAILNFSELHFQLVLHLKGKLMLQINIFDHGFPINEAVYHTFFLFLYSFLVVKKELIMLINHEIYSLWVWSKNTIVELEHVCCLSLTLKISAEFKYYNKLKTLQVTYLESNKYTLTIKNIKYSNWVTL